MREKSRSTLIQLNTACKCKHSMDTYRAGVDHDAPASYFLLPLACSLRAVSPPPAAAVSGSTMVCTQDTSPALPPFASCAETTTTTSGGQARGRIYLRTMTAN
jgi:hypothetical protein